ncbi:MAG: sodium-dependent transporter [Alphaproteobacteria bacterium]
MASGGHEQWSSRMAFIFAAVGSAVGLGNIWRFPYMAGENGGAAFVLIYIGFVLFIGMPVLMAELTIGRRGGMSPINSVKKIAEVAKKSPRWSWVGGLGAFGGGLGLLSYYSVIAGLVLAYIIKGAFGAFSRFWADPTVVGLTGDAANAAVRLQSEAEINSLFGDPGLMVMWHFVFIGITIFIVARGINAGLEKAVTYLMPLLFLILLVLVGYSMATGEFGQAITYLFEPDFSKVTAATVLAAVGQAFFSLSLTVGTMLAYGAYLPKSINIPKSAAIIAGADTGVALIAGMAIFPLVFAYGLAPDSGPSLIFETLPIAFGAMPGGQIFGTLFFVLLAIAAITSSISLLEPAVSYFEEKQGMNRWKSSIFAGGAAFAIGLLSVFSYNAWADLLPLGFLGVNEINGAPANFYTLIDFTVANIIMPVGGLLLAIFAGWIALRKDMRNEMGLKEGGIFEVWHVLVKYVCPPVLIIIIISGLT